MKKILAKAMSLAIYKAISCELFFVFNRFS